MKLKFILFYALVLCQAHQLFAAQATQEIEPQRITPQELSNEVEKKLTEAYMNEVVPEYKQSYQESLAIATRSKNSTINFLSKEKQQKFYEVSCPTILLMAIKEDLFSKVQANVILLICRIVGKKPEEIPVTFIKTVTNKIVKNLINAIAS